MEKQYSKIAKKTKVPAQGVHLVHYVLQNMSKACVFPPKTEMSSEPFFCPINICSAIIAYLKQYHPDDPWGTLKKFGLKSSEQVGEVAKAIRENSKVETNSDIEIDVEAFKDIFSEVSASQLRPIRWYVESAGGPEKIEEAHKYLSAHFGKTSFDSLVVSMRRFPEHVRADLQLALDQIFESRDDVQLFGVNRRHSHENLDFRSLTSSEKNYEIKIGPLEYSEISVGSDESVRCLANGLWLAEGDDDIPFAVVLGTDAAWRGNGVQVEFATLDTEEAQNVSVAFFDDLQRRVEDSRCYRGKILSFERSDDYHGRVSGVNVHELKHVDRDQVILPQKTMDLLDRNIVDFVQQRPELKKRGMNLKKGLLFFGPPGTGKTHTVHYLSRALPGTTTLIITSEQLGWLSRYMTLARLLQPSLVIIEDADLIARQREEMGTCEEVLLNKLLNEMDGLRADSEIIFVLTTNRPETLEEALTARPGRIDQAIEFPLPDESGRRQLAMLYAGNQQLESAEVELIVRKTENTSAAFIKELMRRATQYAIVRGLDEQISSPDIETAVEEMLFSGGMFNRKILGAISEEDSSGN